MDLKETKIPKNFSYPLITEQHYRFGSGQVQGVVLRSDGDWRGYTPAPEDQNIRGIESSACYVEGSQHAIATLEEEMLGEKDANYSARFNALLSDGSQDGGDPLKGADSIRHDGLVAQNIMPFDEEIQSWQDFHSWKGVDELGARALGKDYLQLKGLANDIVFERYDSLVAKYDKLRTALKYSPCPISVTAWFQGADGLYHKPQGMNDNHLVLATYVDDQNRIYVWDTYAEYSKVLAPWFNSDFAMRWSVTKQVLTPVQKESFLESLYAQLVSALVKLLKLLYA